MEKKIYALVRHDFAFDAQLQILNYYSTKKKALCALKQKADAFGVGIYDTDGFFSSHCVEYCGESFFYCIREINVL